MLNPKVHWLAFHGGYDFAYLLRCMSGANLPSQVRRRGGWVLGSLQRRRAISFAS